MDSHRKISRPDHRKKSRLTAARTCIRVRKHGSQTDVGPGKFTISQHQQPKAFHEGTNLRHAPGRPWQFEGHRWRSAG